MITTCSNTSGAAPWNDRLGDHRVRAHFPDAAGDFADFTPTGAASNREAVDETVPDEDTSYVASATAGHKDLHHYPSSPATTITAVKTVARWRKDDAGARTARTVARVSGTDNNGPTVGVGDLYTRQEDIRQEKPGGGAWAPSDFNGSQHGYELVS